MIWELDTNWMLFAIAAVAAIAYMLALLLEAVLGGQGYGPFGNAFLITAGFFGAIYLANRQGIDLSEVGKATAFGLVGAFVVLFVMVLLRMLLRR